MEKSNIAWHPAFVKAIELELDAYTDSLEFHSEYQLTTEPLKIDCVVVKKAKGVVVKKNFAAVFRDVNILEYKSPDDYVSVADFYKVYGYACLYVSLGKISVTGLTISFVQSRYPGRLLKHLKNVRGYVIEEKDPGIYTVKGDVLPIQIIDNRRLSAEENLWLNGLSKRLDLSMFVRVSEEAGRYSKDARIGVYLDVIMRANFHLIEEARKMSGAAKSFEEAMIRSGWAAVLEARIKAELEARIKAELETRIKAELEARIKAELETRIKAELEAREKLAIARNMVNLGYPVEAVVSVTGLELEKVEELYSRE